LPRLLRRGAQFPTGEAVFDHTRRVHSPKKVKLQRGLLRRVVAELRHEQSAAMSAGDSGADLASGAYDIDWSKLTARLPVGKDTASALRRGDL
jgi:hypothetical protein